MSKLIFGTDNKVLSSNLSLLSGTADAQFPLSNIKHDFTTKVFRSSTNTVTLLIDLQQTSEVDLVCLKGSSVDGIGFNSVTIEGSPSTVFNNTPVNIDISATHNFAFKELESSSHRFWKLVFTGSSYVEISNLYIGKKTQLLNNNLNIGFSYSSNTNNSVSKNTYGQRFINTYNSVDTLSGEIKLVNGTEFDQLNAIQVQHGESIPLWFLLDPLGSMTVSDSEFLFSGYFFMKDLTWKSIAPNLYDVGIVLEEAI